MGMFIATLFVIAPIWEHPTCTAQWDDKEIQYICRMEPKTATRMSDLEPNSMLSKIHQTQRAHTVYAPQVESGNKTTRVRQGPYLG